MSQGFPTTQWDQVDAAARGDVHAAEALLNICRAYWYPVYAFIRSRGHGPDDAADLTQGYFARLMEGRLFQHADRQRGRFRALLRTDCAFYLADEVDKTRAAKRGGGKKIVQLDAAAAEHRYHLEPVDRCAPEQIFDRAWAADLLARAMHSLQHEECMAGRGESFAALSEVLAGPSDKTPYRKLAESLGTTEGAVEAAVRRLRGRYRRALRRTIAETRLNPTEPEIDEEINELFDALSK